MKPPPPRVSAALARANARGRLIREAQLLGARYTSASAQRQEKQMGEREAIWWLVSGARWKNTVRYYSHGERGDVGYNESPSPMCLSETPLTSSRCLHNRIINYTLTVYHWCLLEVQYSCKLITFSDCFPPSRTRCFRDFSAGKYYCRLFFIITYFLWQISSGHLIKLNWICPPWKRSNQFATTQKSMFLVSNKTNHEIQISTLLKLSCLKNTCQTVKGRQTKIEL